MTARPTPTTVEELVRLRIVHPIPAAPAVDVRKDVLYRGEGSPEHRMDVFSPVGAAGDLPAVLLVHGGPVPRMGAKNLGVFLSYGELLAANGLVAITFDHGFTAAERLSAAAEDVVAAIDFVRGHAEELGVDAERLALWAFSGGGPLLSVALRRGAAPMRALLAFCAVLDLEGFPDPERPGGGLPPFFVARAGRDAPALNATVDRFVAAALAANAPLDVMNHPSGRHGFDILDDDARSREIIGRAVEFLRHRLE